MNRFLKTLLLWLLLAALPLQGIAAAMQTACGPLKQDDSAETTLSVQSHHHDGDAMNMSDTDAADAGAVVKSAMPHDKSAGDQHKHASCSACASCCVGAFAPPSTAVITPTYSNLLPAVVTPVPLLTSFIPTGLERPPKPVTT